MTRSIRLALTVAALAISLAVATNSSRAEGQTEGLTLTATPSQAHEVAAFGLFTRGMHTNRRISPCDDDNDHGMGSAVLCQQDHLVKGSYIVSPNDQYRMYFQSDGALNVLNLSDYEHPSLEYQIFGPFEDPGSLEVSVWFWIDGCEVGSLCAINTSDELVVRTSFGHELEGEWFWRIENDGGVRLYDQDGSREVLNLRYY